jgi:hypothetical protein
MDWDQINAMGQVAGMRQRQQLSEQQKREAEALRSLLEEQERQRRGVCPCPHCGGGIPQKGVTVCMHCRHDLHWKDGHCGATSAEAQRLAQEAQRLAQKAATLAASEAAALAAARATCGQLDVVRSRKMTGWCYSVELFVDGRLSGKVGNGQSVQINIPAGRRTIEARGGGLRGKLKVDVQTGQTSRVKVYFSDLGFLGGGLVVKPA